MSKSSSKKIIVAALVAALAAGALFLKKTDDYVNQLKKEIVIVQIQTKDMTKDRRVDAKYVEDMKEKMLQLKQKNKQLLAELAQAEHTQELVQEVDDLLETEEYNLSREIASLESYWVQRFDTFRETNKKVNQLKTQFENTEFEHKRRALKYLMEENIKESLADCQILTLQVNENKESVSKKQELLRSKIDLVLALKDGGLKEFKNHLQNVLIDFEQVIKDLELIPTHLAEEKQRLLELQRQVKELKE